MMKRNSFVVRAIHNKIWLPKTTYYKNSTQLIHNNTLHPSSSSPFNFSITPFSFFRFFNTKFAKESDSSDEEVQYGEYPLQDKTVDEESNNEWEEEDETEPEIDDGGDGGGIVLGDISWGQRALDIANEVLGQLSDDIKIFAFKNTPRGYIYVRLDKLPDKYGCPSMDEIEQYSCLYKKRLEEVGESGEIPDDLALEVSSPGAERILRVPDDLDRFQDIPMRVCYVEDDLKSGSLQKDGVFFLDSIENEMEQSVWKLADVKENRDPLAKGRPMTRKQRDWRLTLPFGSLKRVTLYLEY